MALETKDREKLEKLLNMLGSPNDGEIGNAGRMIKKMADRYNVTPSELCLGSPQAPRSSSHGGQQQPKDDPFYGAGFGSRGRWGNGFGQGGYGGHPFGSWAERERERQRQEDEAFRREQQRKRDEAFHRQREEELRQEGERRAREQAKRDARKPRHFGNYFGLLGRLLAIYQDQFNTLEEWMINFIETVLDSCAADRQMTRRQIDMAKAILKAKEEAEPLV